MDIITLLILATGLSMDAFAVSICKGLSIGRPTIKEYTIVGLWFGIFQALMPIVGWAVGATFCRYIEDYDHWVVLVLLAVIGGNMIREAYREQEEHDNKLDWKTMLLLAIATSIDALAVGLSLAFLEVNIWHSAIFIGVVTFLWSILGMKIGSIFGNKYHRKAEIVGGIILISIGIKVVIEHLL